MPYDFIAQLVDFWFAHRNCAKVELAALEPLLYKDGARTIIDVCQMVSKHYTPSITTNGFFLDKYDQRLKDCTKKIRISLHAMDRQNYRQIMGFDGFDRVVSNIENATKTGLNISLNRVLLRGYTHDLKAQIEFVDRLGISLKLFDLYYTEDIAQNYQRHYISVQEALQEVLDAGLITYAHQEEANRDRVVFTTQNGSRVEYKQHALASKNHPPCSLCDKAKQCIEGYKDYLRVFPNKWATFCYMRQDLDFPLVDSQGHFQMQQQEDYRFIPLRLCLVDTCNYNCGYPGDKASWCLKRFRPFTYLSKR
ncbi:radical SAM protein [Helicobacter felis]|uniref:radical SAM protein n=1 Tax=Helicobacter felis TaxID=214 RepID=UPI001F29AE3C|nr:radical SAM protein [Helicobacter felis]